ncbi:hybrid sensor histidine kinase/response regulator [Pseudanabaena sp. BC1403]|uniref:hybrid sensor histidine kinase/response regulator n=1 Tax=Pseudanabaena sp. BC1403 TaxID=2043171 RepID=UPI000CD8E54C|nr:hybrid sensor histidine kinase/response regulator [Pseudanabaena sp. BC1403]
MNSEQQQQRIMGYFIEEAREHLQTIEQGVLNLQDVLNDSESVNELFRAAHSIKGGAAMLGVGSIQHVAHRLEDFFKILKENPQMPVDERLKSLLLAGFDPLSELLDELQGGYKISDELTLETNNRVKPVFAELESYLNQLVSDADGEISTSHKEEIIPQPQEVVVSQRSIFQQEITTKMRDMLQLFRATDNAESRSQLQAVCNYFQEIGNNFDLRNWTNLVTQIKNAIAQPSNSYRTLAPILIRELKEAQDLVLANRELEIAVSIQLQNLLPNRFSESEDDEVSTIFTTASGDFSTDSNVDGLGVSDKSTSGDLDLNLDADIDLFADQVNEEVFDLPNTHKNQINQMDWMDGEYEITENQHIDGPKVGASELKSLAILFENDDIDFDSAWEDIESNETNIAAHGSTTNSASHDEFADLLDNNSVHNDVTVPNLSSGESSIDQLFGEFPAQDLTAAENSSSLFPDDLDESWGEPHDNISEIISEAIPEREQASLDRLFTEDFTVSESLGDQFDLDIGIDIVEQIGVDQVDDELSIDNQFNNTDIGEIDVEEDNFFGLESQSSSDEQFVDRGLFDTDESQPLSSEEYFAAIAREENAMAGRDGDISSEPFALTFSEEEEGIDFLDDPFAIDDSLDEVLLESSFIVDNNEDINADVDNFFEESEEIGSNDYADAMYRNNGSDGIDTTGLHVFDELGFDNDEFDKVVSHSQVAVDSTNVVSDIIDTNPDNFLIAATDSSDIAVAFNLLNESIEFTESPVSAINNAELEDGFYTSSVDESYSNFTDFTEDNETNSVINDAGDLADFFAEPSEANISDAIASEFGDEYANTDDLGDFFAESEEPAITSEISDIGNAIDEYANTDDLGDFFAESEEPAITGEISDIGNAIDEYASTDDLGDFFAKSEEPAITSEISDIGNAIGEYTSTDDLGDFFAESEEPNVSIEVNDELNDSTDRVDITEESDDFFSSSEDSEITSNDFFSDNSIDGFEQEFANTESLEDFFADSDATAMSSDIPDSSEPTYEFNNIESLGEFFDVSEDSEISSSNNNELDDYANVISNADDLGNFFDEAEESQSITENIANDDSDELGSLLTNSNELDSRNLVDISKEDQESFVDYDSTEDINSNFLSMVDEDISDATPEDLAERFFEQINSPSDSNLDNLFIDAEEEDLNLVEDEINFDQAASLTQGDEINDLTSMLDDNFQDAQLRTIGSGLTSFQEDINFEDNNASAKTTIDNLVDFFQVDDDDSEVSLLQNPEEEFGSSSLTDNNPLDFGEFSGFAGLDEDISETDYSLTQDPETKNLEPEQQLQTEELNGIDDNFDFDDLEAMIGSSSNMPNDVDAVGNRTFDDQTTATVLNDQASADSHDMNFDELEALLGESNSFDNSKKTQKATDEFDELENMLQTAFAKDVGPIKTKPTTRQPAATRKPRLTDSTMRVDVKYLDSLNNLVGELVVNRNLLEQDQERLQQFITNLLHQVQLLSDVSQRMRDQYDRSLLEASLTAGRGGRSSYSFDSPSQLSDGANSNSSVTNDFEGIEFDRYNTFHVLSQEIIELIVRVRESASDIEFVVGETDQVTRQLGTITTQVQDDLKQSRMVPFAQIADRLPRGIRDRALKTGKQAELEIFGRETLIDKAILEQLTDPLTHLVNNAIDHGLEDPSTRQAAGKSATGKLTVRAYHQGNQTVISISDDGAGISTDKVKKSAVSKGVRSQSEVDRLNDTEVYSLLFEAGFSTAAQADEFKGRGVGLDVVKTCLDDIRGVIIVESVVGKGTTFTIRLPLTLSISKAMFCISDRARIAFPVDGFEDMVEVPQSQIILNEKGQPCLPWRDTVLPFQHLSNLLSYSRHLSRSSIYGKQENDELCIIILRNDTSYLALQVDQFLGEYEIVIKQLEGPIPQPAGIAGATVLGDGRVMAIANVLELFDIASGRLRPSTSGMPIQPTVEEDVAVDPTVLIVDDSITVRELLSLTFAKVGYRVEQAKDGQDAWEKLRAGLPCDMIFCDIEMPRMDGLDLLSRLQKDSRLKEIPVAMLTSRGADRHRQSAIQLGAKGYFTKPYLEEELLSASKRLLAGETLPI